MTHLPHLGTSPQRRRFRALDADRTTGEAGIDAPEVTAAFVCECARARCDDATVELTVAEPSTNA